MEGIEDEVCLKDIPEDFPKLVWAAGAVSGTQQKLLLTTYRGKYYPQGSTPLDRYRRWLICEDLAQQLSKAAMASKLGKRAHMNEEEILVQYLPRLCEKNWGTESEMEWVVNRAGVILGWR